MQDVLRTNFLEAYYAVFNEKGQILVCGRENTYRLIALAKRLGGQIAGYEHLDYGSVETGFMNVFHIQALKNTLESQEDMIHAS